MPPALVPTDIALYLALEGVPVRAIARAVRIPSGDLREQLQEAQADGRLLSLPKDDWPAGPRDQRVPQLSRMASENKDGLAQAAARLFGLTNTESRLLLVLLQNPSLEKNRSDMAGNTVDVHMHSIRKRLQPFGIEVTTVWSFGYEVSARDRRKALGLILEHATLQTE